jgi:hypothetical protein
MFGKGIYTADMVTKSANYCHATPENPYGLLLLCEVALGKPWELTRAKFVERLPAGKNSVKGMLRSLSRLNRLGGHGQAMSFVGHLHQASLCEGGAQHTVTVVSAGIGGTKPDPKETVILPDGMLRGLHAHKTHFLSSERALFHHLRFGPSIENVCVVYIASQAWRCRAAKGLSTLPRLSCCTTNSLCTTRTSSASATSSRSGSTSRRNDQWAAHHAAMS